MLRILGVLYSEAKRSSRCAVIYLSFHSSKTGPQIFIASII